eukprot:481118-Lingulodinium_polyedra.AAC.1
MPATPIKSAQDLRPNEDRSGDRRLRLIHVHHRAARGRSGTHAIQHGALLQGGASALGGTH